MSLKQELLDKCRDMINERISHLQEAMEEAQKTANEYGPPKDRYDSFRTQLLRKRDMFGQQLAVANEQIKALENIDSFKHSDKVGFGALVVTNSQKIFISVGLGKIELNGDTCFAVSPVVPIARILENRGAGDECTFNGQKIKILEVL